MASRMRVWWGLVLGGIFLIGVWGLPPRSFEDWRRVRTRATIEVNPERDALNRIQSRITMRNRQYQRLQWMDSVVHLARVSTTTSRGWSVQLPDSATERIRTDLETAVASQLLAIGVQVPRVPVGLILMDGGTGTHPEVTPRYSLLDYGLEIYVGRTRENPFCFLLSPVRSSVADVNRIRTRLVWVPPDSSAAPAPLGPCALYAKYGHPGPGLLEWLAAGRHAMALAGPGLRPIRGLEGFREEAIFAMGRRALWYEGSPEAEACLAGKVEGCRGALFRESGFQPWHWARNGDTILHPEGLGTRLPDFGYYLPFGGTEFNLLWELERAFGAERFQAFWSSDLSVEEAFREAFGQGFPEWVMAWGQEALGVSEVDPRVPLEATFLSFLTIGVFAVAALFLGRRRG